MVWCVAPAELNLSGGQPPEGCLFASYCYEIGQFEDEVAAIIKEAMLTYRQTLLAKLEEVASSYPPRLQVDLESLADTMMTIFEGGFVVARTVDESDVVVSQLRHVRNYFELLFPDDDSA